MCRFLDVIWPDVSFSGCYLARWGDLWMFFSPVGVFLVQYGPMCRAVDVVWYDLGVTKALGLPPIRGARWAGFSGCRKSIQP